MKTEKYLTKSQMEKIRHTLFDRITNDDDFIESVEYAFFRWEDEKEYEDKKDYTKRARENWEACFPDLKLKTNTMGSFKFVEPKSGLVFSYKQTKSGNASICLDKVSFKNIVC